MAVRAELVELVRKSPLSVQATLATAEVPRSTFYAWHRPRRSTVDHGGPGLPGTGRRAWNRLRESEEAAVLHNAHCHTDLSPRQLACKLMDDAGFSVSESTVYRILKRNGLVKPAVTLTVKAAPEFHRKTTRVHELWQTDLTYFFVVGWGWYYIGGVLDDFSRYLITVAVVPDMTGPTLSDLVQVAVEGTGMSDVPVSHKPVLLSDNGSGYISAPFNDYLRQVKIRHIFAAPMHPQTCGKYERLNRTTKDRLGLVLYRSPGDLEAAVQEFRAWYNHERYHEALGNLRPVDVYEGRGPAILARRKEVRERTIKQRRQWNLGMMATTGVNEC